MSCNAIFFLQMHVVMRCTVVRSFSLGWQDMQRTDGPPRDNMLVHVKWISNLTPIADHADRGRRENEDAFP